MRACGWGRQVRLVRCSTSPIRHVLAEALQPATSPLQSLQARPFPHDTPERVKPVGAHEGGASQAARTGGLFSSPVSPSAPGGLAGAGGEGAEGAGGARRKGAASSFAAAEIGCSNPCEIDTSGRSGVRGWGLGCGLARGSGGVTGVKVLVGDDEVCLVSAEGRGGAARGERVWELEGSGGDRGRGDLEVVGAEGSGGEGGGAVGVGGDVTSSLLAAAADGDCARIRGIVVCVCARALRIRFQPLSTPSLSPLSPTLSATCPLTLHQCLSVSPAPPHPASPQR